MRGSIGIIAEEGAIVFSWSATEEFLRERGICITFLIEKPIFSPRRFWRVAPARVLWRAILFLEQHRIGWKPNRYTPVDPIELPCVFRGHFKEFPENSLLKISERRFDCIIRLGGRGIYRGSILTAARGGLISIHHGDNRKFRGGPPGFWEIVAGETECGLIVQRLTEKLDGGVVLARKNIRTSILATVNIKNLYECGDLALREVISNFLRFGELKPVEAYGDQLGPIFRMPGLLTLSEYIWKSWIVRQSIASRHERSNAKT